ncbi:MAG: hypothetical protein RLN85_16445, partial [Pseudomonadales bacterium]
MQAKGLRQDIRLQGKPPGALLLQRLRSSFRGKSPPLHVAAIGMLRTSTLSAFSRSNKGTARRPAAG